MTSAQQDQSIILHVTNRYKNARVPLPKLRKLTGIVCERFGPDNAPNRKYEISIAVVDDTQIRQLSGQFLNRKATTDCLSFDLSDSHEEESQAEKPRVLEIIVNGEMAARQGPLREHSSEAARNDFDGLFQQARLAAYRHRKQVGNGCWLLHVVWRHVRRVGGTG